MPDTALRTVFGPFHRLLAAEVQDSETLRSQVLSGEIWGRAPSWGGSPAVKAYPGALSAGDRGVEFWSFQAPDAPSGPRAYWRTDGDFVTIDEASGIVRLQIAFVRVTQDLLP
jgi:hypothetical protein